MINHTVAQLMHGLSEKQFSSEELTSAFLNRIEALNGSLNSFITVDPESAMNAARKADEQRASGSDGKGGTDGDDDGGEEPEPDEKTQVDEEWWLGREDNEVEDSWRLGESKATQETPEGDRFRREQPTDAVSDRGKNTPPNDAENHDQRKGPGAELVDEDGALR